MSAIEDLESATAVRAGEKAIRAMAEALVAKGLLPEEIGRVQKLGGYQGFIKNNDGEFEKHDLYKWEIMPTWEQGPEWPVIQPGPRFKVPPFRPAFIVPGSQRMVVLPDMQIGYFRLANGEYESIHDTAAIDAAIALIKDAKPSIIVMLGDNLDLTEFGKYRLSPPFQYTTQRAVDYATELCARIRSVAPHADIYWLAGNHEERLPHFVADNATPAYGLRQGGAPESWPVMSVPHLCRLDEFGVIYKPGYPASDLWITPKLKIIHGDRVKSKGSTAHMYLPDIKVSVIYGHVHRIERAHIHREDFEGGSEVMAASPGCLARTDGVVPSTGQGLDLDGRPLPSVENWNQGLAVVTLHEDDTFDYEQLHIRNGRTFWRDKWYSGNDTLEEVA